MTNRRRVLFLCTGNSCRSQMAEALLRRDGGDAFDSCSAGSHPAGFIHDLALEAMRQLGLDYARQSSKSWDEFKDTRIDAVITLCDSAAGQVCPAWRGSPLRAHWSLPDPAAFPGTQQERLDLAMCVAGRLEIKIRRLLELDWTSEPDDLTQALNRLGDI
jgi:arsenate reductase